MKCPGDTRIHKHIYQIGVTGGTIRDKLPDGKTVVGVAAALDQLVVEKAAGRMPGSARFKFGYMEQNWTPTQAAIDQFNYQLTLFYGGTPPQIFALGDFEFISLTTP